MFAFNAFIVVFPKISLFFLPKDYFHVPLSEDKQGRRYLELMYSGAVLKDSWILADVGISVSSTIKCVVKVWHD